MGFMDPVQVSTALQSTADLLLADIAIRIQLTRTDHDKAVSRYEAINDWLDRADSLLSGRISLMYPQGSMAIGSTIASALRTDEFDIDIIAELALPLDTDPGAVLDLLCHCIRGERGSRYYTMTKRRSRCVTVIYADGMHLDITPVVLVEHLLPKTSLIFHHELAMPEVAGYRLLANPYGFADWFRDATPLDHAFAVAFATRAMDAERVMAIDKAEAMPVPARNEAHQKSTAVIALQLLKRARNVCYDQRRNLRRPPSVMMAKLIADAANHTTTLTDEVLHQARYMHAVIDEAHRQGRTVDIRNPRCNEDLLTDRWPGSLPGQELYLSDLEDFIAKMTYLAEGECDLEAMQEIMAHLFGENPTGTVFESFTERLGQQIGGGRSVYQPGTSVPLSTDDSRGGLKVRFWGHEQDRTHPVVVWRSGSAGQAGAEPQHAAEGGMAVSDRVAEC